jgi:hypothetical protein
LFLELSFKDYLNRYLLLFFATWFDLFWASAFPIAIGHEMHSLINLNSGEFLDIVGVKVNVFGVKLIVSVRYSFSFILID